ncbi:hypothetical protein COLO4_27419 [Corchorus olitorius]|uniref:Retrovirus-related Pol polyprotein from transposon TNT 1-94-like beta-barrel domain-containing protein n=1 Tax=Corchorus olitorius TaxID=93759 RepID=A0A1R3HR45_9ROSI|nr:hypothetical protein COLO4_27419 [Corchorus olitorius]
MASEQGLSSTTSAAISSSSPNSSSHTSTSSLGFSLSTTNAFTANFNHPVQVRLDRNNFLLWRLEQHTLSESITANVATKTNSSTPRPPRNQERGRRSFCGRGRGRGRSNPSFNTNTSNGNVTNRPQCQVCSKFGHSALDCFHRFDHGYQSSQTTNSSALMASASSISHDDDWFPDSGASNHLTADLSNMSIHSEYQGQDRVKVGNETCLPIKHVGSSKLKTLTRPLYLK